MNMKNTLATKNTPLPPPTNPTQHAAEEKLGNERRFNLDQTFST